MGTGYCWRCGGSDPESLFCKYCNSLQAPITDYYNFFGLPKKLTIDLDDLQRRFYNLSRSLHPDHYTRATPQERQYSLEATSILNDGYRILRDPVQRAEYILKEAGFDIGEQRTKDVPPELLEEVFELNMQLDELRSGDEDARRPLEESRERFTGLQQDVDRQLVGLFLAYDSARSPEAAHKALADIRAVLNRRRYIRNLLREVDKELTARPV